MLDFEDDDYPHNWMIGNKEAYPSILGLDWEEYLDILCMQNYEPNDIKETFPFENLCLVYAMALYAFACRF